MSIRRFYNADPFNNANISTSVPFGTTGTGYSYDLYQVLENANSEPLLLERDIELDSYKEHRAINRARKDGLPAQPDLRPDGSLYYNGALVDRSKNWTDVQGHWCIGDGKLYNFRYNGGSEPELNLVYDSKPCVSLFRLRNTWTPCLVSLSDNTLISVDWSTDQGSMPSVYPIIKASGGTALEGPFYDIEVTQDSDSFITYHIIDKFKDLYYASTGGTATKGTVGCSTVPEVLQCLFNPYTRRLNCITTEWKLIDLSIDVSDTLPVSSTQDSGWRFILPVQEQYSTHGGILAVKRR